MSQLQDFLINHTREGLLPWAAQEETAKSFGLTLHQVEEVALATGILPARYQRNGKTLSVEQQYKLFKSRVAVIGCGGLGGYILEELARLGAGDIVAVDFDVFEEHNLNRQLLSCPAEIGRLKVDAAAERVAKINPAVKFTAYSEPFAAGNGPAILDGAQVAVDALDSVGARLTLAGICNELNLPFVHGAICGWYGQVATQYPSDAVVEKLYRSCTEDKGMEKIYGNASFTPAVIASLQVAEVCKILLGQGETLRRRVLYLNLLDMELEVTVMSRVWQRFMAGDVSPQEVSPVNIRELENCIESMVAMAEHSYLTTDDLPAEITRNVRAVSCGGTLLEQQTKKAIIQALAETNGKIAPAARLLGIGRTTLYRKIEELGIKS